MRSARRARARGRPSASPRAPFARRDYRNDFERDLDVKFFLALAGMVAWPILWVLHRLFGIGQDALEFVEGSLLLFGVYLTFLLTITALAWGIGRVCRRFNWCTNRQPPSPFPESTGSTKHPTRAPRRAKVNRAPPPSVPKA